MDTISENNNVMLCGNIAGKPEYSHSARGQEFYVFPLEIRRLSGNYDTINIVIRREHLIRTELGNGEMLRVSGQLRTFNNRNGEGAKLVITVFAKELEFVDECFGNQVSLNGTLCKKPILRCTPMGRDICDLMLAVNRHYGRSDYLPCICWGSLARSAADWDVGTKLHIEGRIQSRKYIKLIDGQAIEKTAFEVSVTEARETEKEFIMSTSLC